VLHTREVYQTINITYSPEKSGNKFFTLENLLSLLNIKNAKKCGKQRFFRVPEIDSRLQTRLPLKTRTVESLYEKQEEKSVQQKLNH
jgi:hypothetical protein